MLSSVLSATATVLGTVLELAELEVASQQFSKVASVPAASVLSDLVVYPDVQTSTAHLCGSQHAAVRVASSSVRAESMVNGLGFAS